MRIIAGSRKGTRLAAPKGIQVRPTRDRVKESLFNILRFFNDAIILDLFSGTGGFGLEALSRGAQSVTFVEKSSHVIRILTKNVYTCRFEEQSHIIKSDVFAWLVQNVENHAIRFDYIFADPPYDKGYVNKLVDYPLDNILSDKGLFVIEHSPGEQPDSNTYNKCWEVLKKSHYGETEISILKPIRE